MDSVLEAFSHPNTTDQAVRKRNFGNIGFYGLAIGSDYATLNYFTQLAQSSGGSLVNVGGAAGVVGAIIEIIKEVKETIVKKGAEVSVTLSPPSSILNGESVSTTVILVNNGPEVSPTGGATVSLVWPFVNGSCISSASVLCSFHDGAAFIQIHSEIPVGGSIEVTVGGYVTCAAQVGTILSVSAIVSTQTVNQNFTSNQTSTHFTVSGDSIRCIYEGIIISASTNLLNY